MKYRLWWDQICAELGIERADDGMLRAQFEVLIKQIPALYCVLLLSSATLAYKVAHNLGGGPHLASALAGFR